MPWLPVLGRQGTLTLNIPPIPREWYSLLSQHLLHLGSGINYPEDHRDERRQRWYNIHHPAFSVLSL